MEWESPKNTPHHYQLAHVALRDACLGDPKEFFSVMSSPERHPFLKLIWDMLREKYDWRGEPGFDITDVEVAESQIKGFPCLIFTMPEPKDVTEAYFVCIVLKLDEFEYYTLEKSFGDKTVLGGWRKFDSRIGIGHVNYGFAPEPTVEDFMAAVEDRV